MNNLLKGLGVGVVVLLLWCGAAWAGNVGTSDIVDNAITTLKIADGAVTDVKISGQISSAKVSRVGLDSDTLDGLDSSKFASSVHEHFISDVQGLNVELQNKADLNHSHPEYALKSPNEIIVAKQGGDFIYIDEAINSITDASASNPYVVKIMPGNFSFNPAGIRGVVVPEYVRIVGSGRNSTFIQDLSRDDWQYTFEVPAHSSIEDLSIKLKWYKPRGVRLGGTLKGCDIELVDGFVHAIAVQGSGSELVVLDDVKITISSYINSASYGVELAAKTLIRNSRIDILASASGTGGSNFGLWRPSGGSIELNVEDVDINITVLNTTSSAGIYVYGSGLINLSNVRINSSNDGIRHWASEGQVYVVKNSVIEGARYAVKMDAPNPSANMLIANSLLEGGFSDPSTHYACSAVFDKSFNPVVCP